MVVAYEPIWAIGTGRTATPDDANATIGVIRTHIRVGLGDALKVKIHAPALDGRANAALTDFLADKLGVRTFDLAKSAAKMTAAGFTKDSANFWVGKDGKRVNATIDGFENIHAVVVGRGQCRVWKLRPLRQRSGPHPAVHAP